MEKYAHIHSINTDSLKKQVKISGSEKSVSHTIEELLDLNKMIPARWGNAVVELQEGQLDKTPNRWEEDSITQKQLSEDKDIKVPTHWGGDQKVKKQPGEKDASTHEKEMVGHKLEDHRDETGITEVRFNDPDVEAHETNRREEAWDKDDIEVRGHENVAPIWHEVYMREDNWKATDKGQLDKKKKPQKNV